ncbi:GDSL-type esterase/lipase family protein [Paenibacillus pinistramenti]|uniref:GDSL-type esterase/lipase family protein n=1 Tax=Paenibacillus pinistramenti TaxID=1768003 RepID=UPI001109BB5F|nr:GDSL-type esterase/lipase family protein [Paenibacillus pinistramenti]
MRSTAKLWRMISLLSGIATVLLICGFFYAVKDISNPSSAAGISVSPGADSGSEQPAPSASDEIGIVAIGDSLAKGTGDDEGEGFAGRTVELLKQENPGREVKLYGNLGINGLLTTGLLDELKENGVQHMLKEANVILLSIGGNDLFQGAEALEEGGDLPTAAELNKAIDEASVRLAAVIPAIKKLNPEAALIYVGLYNPFSDIEQMRAIGNTGVTRWNTAAQTAVNKYSGALMIPTYDLFAGNLERFLSSDHFHPNGDGYEQIAQRIVQSLKQ